MKNTMQQPSIPIVIQSELSLELTNGARVFTDYLVSDDQISITNARFIRIVEKIVQPSTSLS
jgi:hypothetical protein